MVFTIQDLLYYWEGIGVFDFLLPFLLVFAVVYGILHYMRIFGDNRGVHLVIAVVIGIMSSRFPYFTQFYSEIFPRLGIGVVVLIALLVLTGLFFTKQSKKVFSWILLVIGIVVAIIVFYQTFDVLGWTYGGFGSYGGGNTAAWIITAVLVIGVIVVIAVGNSANDGDSDDTDSGIFERLFPGRTGSRRTNR
jgi:hypothetical protein